MMKMTFFKIKTAVISVLCFMIIFSFAGCAENAKNSEENRDLRSDDTCVKIAEKISDKKESSYQVEATLSGTDFSSVNNALTEKIAQEWKTYDGMSEEKRMLSNHLFGIVSYKADTWNGFEKDIGITVNDPLETLEWLNRPEYVEITANSANAERKLNDITADSEYSIENARITLTATLSASAGTYTTGCVYNGYAEYEQSTVTTGSGIPVLIVITDGTNNNGYYSADFYDPTAYWVKDNVFYTLRVWGDMSDKTEILATLERILSEI